MDILEKAKLTASVRHIAIFLKSELPIYNSEVPDTTYRKTRRRTLAIAKLFASTQTQKKQQENRRPFQKL